MEKKLVFAFLFVLIFPALILVLSGDFLWPEGWIFAAWFLLLCYSTILYLYRKDPALLAERFRKPGAAGHESGTGTWFMASGSGSRSGSSSCPSMHAGSGGPLPFPSG